MLDREVTPDKERSACRGGGDGLMVKGSELN